MNKLESWANWAYQNWEFLLVPAFLLVFVPVMILTLFAPYDELSNRQLRSAMFDELMREMEAIDTPARSAINKSDGTHKSSLILITKRYRTEAAADEFLESMHNTLTRGGWVSYRGEAERIAERTYRYCRGKQDAILFLENKSFFSSDGGDYWRLQFSAGLRSKPLFGGASLPESCLE